MSDDTELVVGIKADVSGTQQTKDLASALATVSNAMNDLVSNAKSISGALTKVEQGVTGVSTQARTAKKDVENLNKELASISKGDPFAATRVALAKKAGSSEFADTRAAMAAKPTAEYLKQQEAETLAIFRAERQLADEREVNLKKLRDTLSIQTQIASQAKNAVQQSKRTSVDETGYGLNSAAKNSLSWAQQREMQLKGLDEEKNKLAQLQASYGQYEDRLANTRYALYSLTIAMGIAGAGMVALNAGAVSAAADFETAFAAIQRTSETSGQELNTLKEQFVDLAQSIPTSVEDLSKIEALGGQLNIPAQELDKFTDVVARFTATTNVGVEASATAFGRLDELLPDVQGNYEALGSSILNVGVNSVATEQEIVSTTGQIAAAGAQAGLTADQVIGLAASYASLGVAPEAARGSTIRVFSEIRTATLEGGAALETFAKLAGESADSFKASWSADAGAAFMDVLNGLNREGANAETTLRGLGITAVRDINALLKLSQNVKLVGDNMGYAADGFSEATKLQDSFAIIAATLASKIQILKNTLQTLFAAIGSSALPVIGALVNGLSQIGDFLTEVAKNPFVSWVIGLTGALTALGGVVLIGAALIGQLSAAVLAGRPVWALATQSVALYRQTLQTARVEAQLAGTSFRATAASALFASTAFKAVAGSLIGLAGFAALGAGIQIIGESMKSAGDKAKDAFGDLSGLSEALEKDTEAAEHGAEVYGTVSGTITTNTKATAGWVEKMENATGGQVQLSDATTNTTTATEKQTFAIGENSKAWIANKLANDEAVKAAVMAADKFNTQELPKDPSAVKEGPDVQFDTQGYLTAAALNDTESAKKILDEYRQYLVDTGRNTAGFEQVAIKLQGIADVASGAFSEAAAITQTTDAVMKALGTSTQGTGNELGEAAGDASTFASALSTLKGAIDSAFQQQNTISQFSSDFLQLAQGIVDGGAAFNYLGASGQANLANLQNSIASTITAGAQMGVSATESVAVLFQQLQKMGVETANLLASVAHLPGVDGSALASYLNGTKAMSTGAQVLATSMDSVAQAAVPASQGIDDVGDSAEEAADKVVEIADYVSDLAEVFARFDELTFGLGDAEDDVAEGWAKIKAETDEAKQAVKDYQKELAGLQSDKAVDQYFLGVAKMYGDDLRAGEIQSDIDDTNKKIKETKQDIADATAVATRNTEGDTEANGKNKDSLQEMYDATEDMILAYANTGASQEDVAKYAATARGEFKKQATQAGYSQTAIEEYDGAFEGLIDIIKKVPRNVTFGVNKNAAQQAIDEFNRKLDQVKAKIDSVNRSKVNIGSSVPEIDMGPLRRALDSEIAAQQALLNAEYARLGGNSNNNTTRMELAMRELRAGRDRLGYRKGGYTGSGNPNNEAGVVHSGEFVFDAPSTRAIGVSNLMAAMNNRSLQVASAPGVSVVELSAYDRKLLAAVGNVQLTIPGQAIASATNGANLVSAKRGTN